MNNFIITTDSGCDFSKKELEQLEVFPIAFNYTDGKNIYKDSMEVSDYKKFYNNMKEGVVFKTSQINPNEYYDFFKELLKYNLPILHISLGSGVSNTINSAYIAINLLKEEFQNVNIKIIDSKIASLGEGYLVYQASKLRKENKTFEEVYNYINKTVLNVNTYYTTNTLTYFARGGRLSKVEAFIGNAFKINPILDCNHLGNLRVVEKCRGSKKAINRIIERIKNTVIDPENQTLFITHADNEQNAIELAQLIVNECHFKDYILTFMGPIIGSHTGPNLIAVFYFGKERKETI